MIPTKEVGTLSKKSLNTFEFSESFTYCIVYLFALHYNKLVKRIGTLFEVYVYKGVNGVQMKCSVI